MSCVPSLTQNCVGLITANVNFTVVDLELDANLEVFLGGNISRAGNHTYVFYLVYLGKSHLC